MISAGMNVDEVLRERHYLGPCRRAILKYGDDFGVMCFGRPASRNVPKDWIELTRWCVTSTEPNAATRQWGNALRWLRKRTDATTIVSYSDPAQGHTGGIYRACSWLWAPTWHRLRPPPTGLGKWGANSAVQGVKDRWVFCLRKDPRRSVVLPVNDSGLLKRYPWASYTEPRGGDWKRFNEIPRRPVTR